MMLFKMLASFTNDVPLLTPSKSLEIALQRIMTKNKRESGITKAFLNVETVFDNTSFHSIMRATRKLIDATTCR